MRVILLFRARVSVSLRRLSNLNPTADPRKGKKRAKEKEKKKEGGGWWGGGKIGQFFSPTKTMDVSSRTEKIQEV